MYLVLINNFFLVSFNWDSITLLELFLSSLVHTHTHMYLFIYVCKWVQLTKLRRNLLLQSLVELLLLNLYLKYLKSHFIITLNFVLINRSYSTPHFTSFLFHSTICQSSTLQQQWPMQINCELHPHTHTNTITQCTACCCIIPMCTHLKHCTSASIILNYNKACRRPSGLPPCAPAYALQYLFAGQFRVLITGHWAGLYPSLKHFWLVCACRTSHSNSNSWLLFGRCYHLKTIQRHTHIVTLYARVCVYVRARAKREQLRDGSQ